ncbi:MULTISPECIES: hypothetical protein [unclassified Pseudomonas]|uniref:hypothetical protein n=1 Tax=unclassified Pseudomonas TaxID=196821 RepID=UPI0012EE2FF9|nr:MULTISPECIES: hypothetical protein [unclassified Pseudomonas]
MNPSIADIMNLSDDNPVKIALLNAGIGNAYDDYCSRVESAILEGIFHFENNKPHFKDFGEDALTVVLVFGLSMKGFTADHDNYRNGHCDLVVKEGLYEWHGEAKLDTGPGYVMEGFRQLCDRYSPGGPTSNRGGLIIYTKKRDKLKILKVWAARIVKDYEVVVTLLDLCSNTLTAKTVHKHAASGLDYKVRHLPISFYHKPTDKSAKNRKT